MGELQVSRFPRSHFLCNCHISQYMEFLLNKRTYLNYSQACERK
jgi:hypothetical protein